MNKLPLALIGLLASTILGAPAFGAPAVGDSHGLANLNYYPHAGELLLEPSFSTAIHDLKGANSETYSLLGSYGLPWDGLRIAVQESERIYANNHNGESTYYSGVGDPTLTLNYRLIDAAPGGLSADVAIFVTPSFGTETYPVAGQAGSNYSRATILGVSASGFWAAGPNEIRLGASATENLSGSYQAANRPNPTEQTSALIANAILTDRVHLGPKVFLEGSANLELGYSMDYSYNGRAFTTDKFPTHVSPTATLGYLAAKNILLSTYLTYSGASYEGIAVNGTTTEFPNGATTWGMHFLLAL